MEKIPLAVITLFIILMTALSPNGSFAAFDDDMDGDVNGSDLRVSVIDINSNLIGYWAFDEGNGTSANDTSGNNYIGQLMDGVLRVAGKSSNAIGLDGENDRVQGMGATPFEYTGGDMSISLWYYADSTDTDGGSLLTKPWNWDGENNYDIQRESSNKITVLLKGSGDWATSFTTEGTLNLSTWNHFVVALSSTRRIKMYLNDVLDTDKPYPTNELTVWTPKNGNTNKSLVFGCIYPYDPGWAGNTAWCVEGKMDNVRIYSTTLSADTIDQIYSVENRNTGEPAILITAPAEGSVLSGSVVLSAEVVGSAQAVEFCVDGTAVGQVENAPYHFSWNSASVSNGTHTIEARALYGASSYIAAKSKRVLVSNGDGIAIQVVPAISNVKILPDTTSLPGSPSTTLTITAARGEFEPASFVIRSQNSALTNVLLTGTSLQNGANSIPLANVDIKSDVPHIFRCGTGCNMLIMLGVCAEWGASA